VSDARGAAAWLLAIVSVGLVACGATGPASPEASPAVRATSTATPAPTASLPATPRPTRSPAARGHDDLADEIEILTLGPELTAEIYAFASDGSAVVFSSGAAPDAAPEAAPDLWRIVPAPSSRPELVWRNPHRDHLLVNVGGDLGTIGFVDIPTTGERAWTLWLVPRPGEPAIVLDEHPGDDEVSSLVPSFSIYERQIVWTAFDRGPDGPVSQLLYAREPGWKPEVLLERPAAEAELWLPSLYGSHVAFTEVRYANDRSSDERAVYHMHVADPAGARRLDASGHATMPILTSDAVLWKEAQEGFNMFNWGRMYRFDLASERVTTVDTWPQPWVNYPSAGERFAAWWGSDSFQFGVYDLVRLRPRLIQRLPVGSDAGILRPHISGDLLAWLEFDETEGTGGGELRYAWLPSAADERGR